MHGHIEAEVGILKHGVSPLQSIPFCAGVFVTILAICIAPNESVATGVEKFHVK
jgi:hypothetical protein